VSGQEMNCATVREDMKHGEKGERRKEEAGGTEQIMLCNE